MSRRPRVILAAQDPEALTYQWHLAVGEHPETTLGEFLRTVTAWSVAPLTEDHLNLPVGRISFEARPVEPDTALYAAPGTEPPPAAPTDSHPGSTIPAEEPSARIVPPEGLAPVPPGHPERLTEREAVLRAHAADIANAARYLESGLSVLVRCEKLLVEHLAVEMAYQSGRPHRVVRVVASAGESPLGPLALGGSRRTALLGELQEALAAAPDGDVIVVPHLDLLAGGTDAGLSSEGREVTDLLYERSNAVLLAFVDPSIEVPEVLASRFAVRLAVDILPRVLRAADGSAVPIGMALVTSAEAKLFAAFDAIELYKHVAGLNALRLRNAMRFAAHQHGAANRPDGLVPRFADLLQELRTFKATTSASFEVPNVGFDAIGGYPDVKEELSRALAILGGAVDLPEHLRHDLVPSGFILYGPPGTGKTLFAKAIASKLNGTIQVVSGPEITDKYVGESERRIRELFAEARRNAPAVLVFDEFDSIAGRRSDRDDGGNRAGNAIVAQLLTELDGFRPEVPVVTVGTTNRIDLIDPALMRPSRFQPIRIDLPDLAARFEIARVHAERFEIHISEQLLVSVARATEGLNGDEIRSIFRDARADQIVGPGQGKPAGPYEIGALVGRIRLQKQQAQINRFGSAQAAAAHGTEGEFRPLAGSRPAGPGDETVNAD
jgi:transitional endoplasmic reticulum ATPase